MKRMFIDKTSKYASCNGADIISEGICVRQESYPHPHVYKYKSPLFLLHESKLADANEVDTESVN